MQMIKPFHGLRPVAEMIDTMIAPPYDVIDRQQARQFVQNKPHSFLHVSKPEIDLPDDIDEHDARVYQQAILNFQGLQDAKLLQRDDNASYYLYRLSQGEHQQLGVFVALASQAYGDGWIKRHELTKPEKEHDRLQHLQALQAHTSPVLLTYQQQTALDQQLQQLANNSSPVYDVTDVAQVRHQLWQINNPAMCAELSQHLNAIDHLYVADGHHRSAAAYRHAQQQTQQTHYFLAALFPAEQLQLLGYHRLITDLGDLSIQQLLTALGTQFDIQPGSLSLPQQPLHFTLLSHDASFSLRLRPEVLAKLDPIARLDANVVFEFILKQALGIQDPRRDPRLSYSGGHHALNHIQQLLQQGDIAIALLMPPLAVNAMLNTADQGQVMPPKSTWFEPKLADGLVCLKDEA